MASDSSVRAKRFSSGARISDRMSRARRQQDRPEWLAIPSIIIIAMLVGIPFIAVIVFSFFIVTPTTISHLAHLPFAYFQNYTQALLEPVNVGATFLTSLAVTARFALLTSLVGVPLGTIAAMSVSERKGRQGVWRAIYLVPYIIPGVVSGLFGRFFFTQKTGLVDQTLRLFHITSGNTDWLDGSNGFWTLLVLEIWTTWPFVYILVLAGLQSVDESLIEASVMDGCGYIGRWRVVIWPSLRRLLLLAIVLSTLFHANNFTLPYVVFDGSPPPSSYVLATNVYLTSFQDYDTGLGSAEGVLMMIVELIPILIYLRLAGLALARRG